MTQNGKKTYIIYTLDRVRYQIRLAQFSVTLADYVLYV